MAAESTQFLIDLRARFQTLTPAQKALSDLEKQLKKEAATLDTLEKKLLKSTPKQAGEILKQVDAQRKSVGELNAAVPAWKRLSEASTKGTIDVAEMAGACEALSVAVAAVVAAAIAGTVAFLGFALASADAARSAHLLDVAAAGDVTRGTELVAVVSQLARKVPVARAELDKLAKSLIDNKLAGLDMQNALTAIAIVSSARGQQAASAIESIAKQSAAMRRFMLGARDVRGEFLALAGTGIRATDVYKAVASTLGISVAAAQQKVLSGAIKLKDGMAILATVAKDKFGATIAGQMLSLTTQVEKARENLALLFSGVNIDKFLVGLATVTDLLSQDTFTGYALKKIFTEVLTGFFETASLVFPYVRAGLIGVAIGALTVYFYFLKAKKAVVELADKLGLKGALKGVDGIKVAMYAGIGAVGVLVGMFALLAVAVLVASFPLLLLVGLLALIVGGALYIGNAFNKGMSQVIAAVVGAWNRLSEVNLWEYGANAIESLIKGVLSKSIALGAAVAAVAGIIPTATADALQQHSPSRIAVAQGQNWTLSQAKGIRDKGDDLEDAARETAGGMASGAGKAGVGGGVGGDAPTYTFNIYTSDDELVAKVQEVLVSTFAEARAMVRA